jgi:hypothetical protein
VVLGNISHLITRATFADRKPRKMLLHHILSLNDKGDEVSVVGEL